MEVAISLGWNCHAANKAVELGIRSRKIEGYMTCPFDECVTNYVGINLCILENFKYFTDTKYLKILKAPFSTGGIIKNESLIYNTRYNFIFNHESPGHANLFISQQWAGGINHYIDNDFKLFKERYINRINNFLNYMNGYYVKFIIVKFSSDMSMLKKTIDNIYPDLKYEIIHILPEDSRIKIQEHYKLMGLSENEVNI